MRSKGTKLVQSLVNVCVDVLMVPPVFTACLTTHLLSMERADWSKLHDMFKARGA